MSTEASSIIISGIGTYTPEKCVPNDELPKHLDTSDEWIRTRTGIGQRFVASKDEHASDMAVAAAKVAIANAKIALDEIDLVIVGTMSPDYLYPATACLVQAKLGLSHVAAFDVHAACSGFCVQS